MSSKDDIANMALLKIGVAPVSLDDPESPIARALNQAYEPNRQKLLRLHNWSFATKTETLQELFTHKRLPQGTSPRHAVFGPARFEDDHWVGHGRHKFALPNDLLRLVVVTHPYRIPYELEGEFLICSARHVRIRYVSDVRNPNQFDPLFTDCLSHLIGGQIAYMVSGAEAKGSALKQEFELLLRDAKRIDSQENHHRPFINTDDLFYARLTGNVLENR